MDLFRIFFTALFVFILTVPFALGIPGLNTGLRLFIAFGGMMFGFFLGFLWNWQASMEEAKLRRQEHRFEQMNQTHLQQIVGKRCWKCDRAIMFVLDANFCSSCNRVICTKCEPTAICSECQRSRVV